ncbi:MAG TPA: cupin domain-containing protein [Jatrophihabitans sp.]|jgi:uncharacterized cupin superfamily protein|nr:cupin domain-containing protein [Jatrophihabitans sp.]
MTANLTVTPHATFAAVAELEDWGPLAEATGVPMWTSGLEVWMSGDQSAGVWQCTPGSSRWLLETNEMIQVVAGRMTVTPDDGEPTELIAGDLAVFPRGWTGTWEIHETVRKVYAIF